MSEAGLKRIHVVAGLIVREGRLLVCQRRPSSSSPLKWEFPGGKVEQGELGADALRRELREELGIDIDDAVEIFRHKHTYPGGSEIFLTFYRVLGYGGEVKNLVFQDISWVKVRALPELDFLEGDLPLIRKLASGEGAKLLS